MLEKIFSFIIGTFFGSFLNVCIYRLPRDLSIIKPRSFCPNCKNSIFWYDNIPIISFLILKAKCRHCKAKISIRYPLVELLAGILFLILYSKFGWSLEFLKYTFFFMFLILVSFIDIDYHAIPAYLCILGIFVALFFSVINTLRQLKFGFISSLQEIEIFKTFKDLVFGLGFVYLFKIFGDIFISVYLVIRKKDSIEGEKEALGLGDVDFMGMVAAFLGINKAIVIFFLAPFIAMFYAIFAILFKRSHLLPYLPYLSLATAIVFFWEKQIFNLLNLVLSGGF